MDTETLKEVVSFLASISTLGQFLSGMPICYKFCKQRSTGEASCLPFISGFLSCSTWLEYGLIIEDKSISMTNAAGAVLCMLYSAVFFRMTAYKKTVAKQFFASTAFLFALTMYSQYLPQDLLQGRMGLLASAVTIVFFAAPLSTLRHVIRVKCTEVLPFPVILCNFIVSMLWLFYGWLLDDPFLEVTNILGCILSGIQLTLFIIYPSEPKKQGYSLVPQET